MAAEKQNAQFVIALPLQPFFGDADELGKLVGGVLGVVDHNAPVALPAKALGALKISQISKSCAPLCALRQCLGKFSSDTGFTSAAGGFNDFE